MSKLNYNDIFRVSLDVPAECRPGSIAWVVGVFTDEDRRGDTSINFRQELFTR